MIQELTSLRKLSEKSKDIHQLLATLCLDFHLLITTAAHGYSPCTLISETSSQVPTKICNKTLETQNKGHEFFEPKSHSKEKASIQEESSVPQQIEYRDIDVKDAEASFIKISKPRHRKVHGKFRSQAFFTMSHGENRRIAHGLSFQQPSETIKSSQTCTTIEEEGKNINI